MILLDPHLAHGWDINTIAQGILIKEKILTAMFGFCAISNKEARFFVDTMLFSDSIISKVCYWLNREFIVSSKKRGKNIEIFLESINGEVEWTNIRLKVSQLLSDYQLREIINEETKDIRTILYVKAFANLDEFEEYE